MRFLNEHTRILHGRHPIDMNDRIGERTAAELALPDNFSDKAKACWEYYKGAAYIFEYKGRLVITDESLYLTDHGDGSHSAPFGGPRWVCDSWEDVERNLEQNYDEVADPELNSGIEPTADERHIMRLNANGVIMRTAARPSASWRSLTADSAHSGRCMASRLCAACLLGGFRARHGAFVSLLWGIGICTSYNGENRRFFYDLFCT